MTTQQQVQAYLDQPRRYFNIDGLGEIGIGVMLLGFALIGWVQVSSPKESLWNTPWGLMLFVIPMSFAIDRGTRFIKKRVTYPRTGFVEYRRSARTVIGIFILSGSAGALFTLAFVKGHSVNIAAIAGLVIVPSYAYGVARQVPWKWAVVAVMVAGSIVIACLPADLMAVLVPAPTITPKVLREAMRSWLLEAPFLGATTLISGGITLYQYLRHTEAPGQATE